MINNVERLKEGSIISESSHYILKKVRGGNADLIHFESGNQISIGMTYLRDFTNSGDLYDEEVKVTKEDKKDGTPGIRTIFEGIHSGQAFTVCFKKQNKAKSVKKYKEEINERAAALADSIDRIKSSKKGVADFAKSAIMDLIENPILPYEEGEDRVLRGYKVQFESRDGKYNCVDMDIEKAEKENGIRPVNINTIKYLIYNGVKYVVE